MDHAHRDDVGASVKSAYLFHEIDLVMNVEKSQRLVEKQVAARRLCSDRLAVRESGAIAVRGRAQN